MEGEADSWDFGVGMQHLNCLNLNFQISFMVNPKHLHPISNCSISCSLILENSSWGKRCHLSFMLQTEAYTIFLLPGNPGKYQR